MHAQSLLGTSFEQHGIFSPVRIGIDAGNDSDLIPLGSRLPLKSSQFCDRSVIFAPTPVFRVAEVVAPLLAARWHSDTAPLIGRNSNLPYEGIVL